MSLSKIIVKYDCGFGNTLSIRGEGCSILSWNINHLLINCDKDTWIWQTKRPFKQIKFKIVLNESVFEIGQNHTLSYGTSIYTTPQFTL